MKDYLTGVLFATAFSFLLIHVFFASQSVFASGEERATVGSDLYSIACVHNEAQAKSISDITVKMDEIAEYDEEAANLWLMSYKEAWTKAGKAEDEFLMDRYITEKIKVFYNVYPNPTAGQPALEVVVMEAWGTPECVLGAAYIQPGLYRSTMKIFARSGG